MTSGLPAAGESTVHLPPLRGPGATAAVGTGQGKGTGREPVHDADGNGYRDDTKADLDGEAGTPEEPRGCLRR